MSATQRLVGIDVATAQVDIALRPTGKRWAVANDDFRIAALVERLQAVQPTLLVLEATGAASGPWSPREPRPDFPCQWSIPARRATWPKPPGSWPRQMPSRHGSGPMVPRRSVRPPDPCLTPRPLHSASSWRGGDNWPPCGQPNKTAAVGVPSLAMPWVHDDGRDQDGLITGPSAGASRAASMRSILAATRAAAFLTG